MRNSSWKSGTPVEVDGAWLGTTCFLLLHTLVVSYRRLQRTCTCSNVENQEKKKKIDFIQDLNSAMHWGNTNHAFSFRLTTPTYVTRINFLSLNNIQRFILRRSLHDRNDIEKIFTLFANCKRRCRRKRLFIDLVPCVLPNRGEKCRRVWSLLRTIFVSTLPGRSDRIWRITHLPTVSIQLTGFER